MFGCSDSFAKLGNLSLGVCIMQAVEFTGMGSRSRLAATVGYIVVIILITAASIAFAMNPISSPAGRELGTYREIVVQPGDTLWDLARSISPEGADLRRAVFEIRTLNGLTDAEILPGQRLLLPVE